MLFVYYAKCSTCKKAKAFACLPWRWVALAVALLAFAPRPAQAAEDAWWGKDKQKHLLISSLAAAATYGWLAHTGVEPLSRAGFASLAVLSIGALKEAWDALGHGQPSWKDMAWNAIGNAVGLLVAWAVEQWLWPGKPSPAPLAPWRIAF